MDDENIAYHIHPIISCPCPFKYHSTMAGSEDQRLLFHVLILMRSVTVFHCSCVVQIITSSEALLPNVGVNSCFLAEDAQVYIHTVPLEV